MNKNIFTTLLILLTSLPLFSQEFFEISTGAGYGQQSYITLADQSEHQVANETWDIAFIASSFGVGIQINESSGTDAMGMAQPAIELYHNPSYTYDEMITIDSLAAKDQLFNSEESYELGAFNMAASEMNPFDFGWGDYNPATHSLSGTRTFIIKLRDGTLKKIFIESQAGSQMKFKYADLDGSNEVVEEFDKSPLANQARTYYSVTNNTFAEVEPDAGFDLFYGRYITPLYDPDNDTLIPYNVTGILTAPGWQAAKADSINPETVMESEFADAYTDRLDGIGHEWKAFSFTDGWILDEDVVYFVKKEDGQAYKLQFIDFEGGTTGTAVLAATDLGVITNIQSHPTIQSMEVFPNPAAEYFHIVYDKIGSSSTGTIQLFNMMGQQVYQWPYQIQPGYNQISINTMEIPQGIYQLTLSFDGHPITKTVVINN